MAHIDLQMNIMNYDLAQIYTDMCAEDPRLGSFDIPVAISTDFILGRHFTHEVQDCLLLSLLDNARCVSLSLHPLMASRMCYSMHNESRFQAGLQIEALSQFLVQDAVCELNFFDHPQRTENKSLRTLVSLLSYEHQMTDIDVGEVTFYQIYGAILEKVKQGCLRFQIHIPQRMLNDINLYGHFAMEVNP